MWRVKFRVYSNVPGQNEYIQYSEVEYYGNKSDINYMIFNRISNTSARCFYYNNVCRLNLTGFNAGYSHILGVGLRSSNNPTSSSYPRTFKIEILETENCTFTFYDSMKKIADISEYNTTNYAGITEYDAYSNGLRELGDDTNIWQLRRNGGNFIVSTALYRYQILLQKNETTLVPINAVNNNTGTSKTLTTDSFNPFAQILYYNSTTTINANSSVGATALYEQMTLDLRYSFNTGTTLTAHKDVYLVAVPQSDGLAKLHTSPISQVLPTTEDGLIYIYLGRAYSNYQIELHPIHPVYEYKEGRIQQYTAQSDRLYEMLVPTGTAIPQNTNLNTLDYLKVGRYYCSANATVATLTNCPTTQAFMMNVFSPLSTTIDNETGNYVYRLRILTALNGDQYIQACNSNGSGVMSYGTWKRIAKNTDIPTVNNGTLTIQKNGTNVQTFTANQSTNATANITVPTKMSELTNDSNYIKNTDYASDTSAGVIRKGNGLDVYSSLGTTSAITYTYEQYNSTVGNGFFISKGTLNNVLTGRGYTTNTGTITGVSVNGTSIATSGVANLVTESAYDASTNKIATMADVGGSGYANFAIETYTSETITVPNLNSIYSGTFTQTKEGYYPIGIVGSWISANVHDLDVRQLHLTSRANGEATASIYIQNTSTSAKNITYSVDILWVKI